MTDLIQRLRDSAKAARALDRSALLVEAADELERLGSLTRFQDRVIRIGGVACLTQAEKTLLTAITAEPDYYGLTETEATVMCGLLGRLHKA